MKKSSAFTLIELLVVIAIIAILAAILFPVFAQAKVAAKKTQSLSNIKQIGLGITMYLNDSDDTYPQSETGECDANHPLVQWYSTVYQYIKSGDKTTVAGQQVSYGKDGIFRAPGYPKAPGTGQSGGQSYGVSIGIFTSNYGHGCQANVLPNGVAGQSMIETPASKFMIAEKGANNADWSYPWFHDWKDQWLKRSICTKKDDASSCDASKDGVDVYSDAAGNPFDSDCGSANSGAWECAAHPRYRYNKTAPFAYMDGHAAAIGRGRVKWMENVWFDRRSLYNGYSWTYDYTKGGWGGGYIY